MTLEEFIKELIKSANEKTWHEFDEPMPSSNYEIVVECKE